MLQKLGAALGCFPRGFCREWAPFSFSHQADVALCPGQSSQPRDGAAAPLPCPRPSPSALKTRMRDLVA